MSHSELWNRVYECLHNQLTTNQPQQYGYKLRVRRRDAASSTPTDENSRERQDLGFLQSCRQIKKEHHAFYTQHTELHVLLSDLTQQCDGIGLPDGQLAIATSPRTVPPCLFLQELPSTSQTFSTS
jgi:hypothetical protein